MKILDHLSSRRIEEAVTGLAGEEGEGGGAGGSSGGTEAEAGEAAARKPSLRQLQTEADPQASTTFTWEETPNIVLDVKGPVTTTFADPVAIWRSAVEQERANSKRFFQIMAAARETQDYVTENILLSFFIPEQLEEEKAVEDIFSNTVSETVLTSGRSAREDETGAYVLYPKREMNPSRSSLIFSFSPTHAQQLVMKQGPQHYFELDRALPSKPH